MKHITTYNEFINEGKVSQFILKRIFEFSGLLSILAQKLKRTYIPFKFKDKKLESKVQDDIIKIIDAIFTNCLKMFISKKVKGDMYKIGFSEYVKSKTGIEVYQLSEEVLNFLKPDNLILSDNEELKSKQLLKLEDTIKGFKKIESMVKMLDDETLEYKKMMDELKELTEIMKELDPRNPKIFNRTKEETLGHFDKALSHLDDMQAPKELDDILDKISKYGMDSLTHKEKEDLNTWSK